MSMLPKPIPDLVGKQFDKLTALRYVGKDKHRQHIWECRCDCGKVVNRSQRTLLSNKHLHSCGCYESQFLIPGTRETCIKAGKRSAEVRNVDGCNIPMLNNSKNVISNTSGHKGISWSKSYKKWHVYVGYKSYRCNLGFVDNIEEGIQLREEAVNAIKSKTFEEWFYDLRGIRIEERLQRRKRRTNK